MIAIVDYGAGNIRSVEFALDRLGVDHRRAARPAELEEAERIVLPGVGHAGSAMAALEETGLADALRATERPVLGICLGLQLLTERSDEADPPVPCLGVVPGRTEHLREGAAREGPPREGAPREGSRPREGPPREGAAAKLRVPHIGWNLVRFAEARDPLFDGLGSEGWFYFLHSLRVSCPSGIVTADAEHGGRFPAAVRHGRFRGVQFHPEKSGRAGLRVLENFCRGPRPEGR